MSTPHDVSMLRNDKTMIRIIVAVILAVVINAGMTAAMAITMQNRFDDSYRQQQASAKVVVGHICNTFEYLYADKPPTGATSNYPARVYLVNLHNRLGEIVTDLNCKN